MSPFIIGANIKMNTVGKIKQNSGISIFVAACAAIFSALF